MIDRRRALVALGGLTATLAGCGSTPRPAPRLAGDPPRRTWSDAPTPRATVLCAHGLGTTSRLFDLPGAPGLAPALARRGLRVVAPDLTGATLAEHTAALTALVAALPRPLVGLGLDLGGTALYPVAGLDALVTLGAPIASGGFSPAQRLALAAPGAPSWATLSRRALADVPLHRLLLGAELPPAAHHALLRDGLAPMPAPLRADWYHPGAAAPVPAPLPVIDALATPRPTLLVLAPADALAPPWQCDPTAFGLHRPEHHRLYVTRANGFGREYGHLELVLHPDARRRVWPSISDWIDEVAAA